MQSTRTRYRAAGSQSGTAARGRDLQSWWQIAPRGWVAADSPRRGERRPQKEEGMPEVDLKKIQPNKMNPRLKFSKSGLDDLASSIAQYGVLEPILVRPVNGHYRVVVGERPYRVAQQAGLETVPVAIRDYSAEEVMEINLVDNVQ